MTTSIEWILRNDSKGGWISIWPKEQSGVSVCWGLWCYMGTYDHLSPGSVITQRQYSAGMPSTSELQLNTKDGAGVNRTCLSWSFPLPSGDLGKRRACFLV